MKKPEPSAGPSRGVLESSVTLRSLSESPHSQVLRRFLAGEITDEELADDGLLRAAVTSVVELQDVVLKMVRRFGPLLADHEAPSVDK